jgi:hypothetical protein
MNLFKKLWLKNLKKGTAPISHFVEDIGPLKGRLSWTKFNDVGKIVDQQTRTNAITINGRSAIVRLLAQAESQKVGAINPADYKITKMRFGNALPTATSIGGVSYGPDGIGGLTNTSGDLQLHYYDIAEATSRTNSQPFQLVGATGFENGSIMGPGGSTASAFLAETNTAPGVYSPGETLKNPKDYVVIAGDNISSATYTFQPNKIIETITLSGNSDYPELLLGSSTKPSPSPSHRTLYVALYNSNNDLIQKVLFTNPYNKGIEGNPVTNVEHGADYNVDGGNDPTKSEALNISSVGVTRIYYDSNDRKWKLQIVTRALIGGISDAFFFGHEVAKYEVGYKVGLYNIKNSIVPVTGYNTGVGKTVQERFLGNQNFYRITQSVYGDSTSGAPIDDYSVAFSVIMGADQGNGKSTGTDNVSPLTNRFVYYTEAFLFNEKDDLFSIIRLNLPTTEASDPKGFVKDPNSSFLLTWQISVDPS